jgi:hypothetical protein
MHRIFAHHQGALFIPLDGTAMFALKLIVTGVTQAEERILQLKE